MSLSKKSNKEQVHIETVEIDEIYTNVAQIHYTPYEFELTCGLVSSNYEGVKPVANIRMSPQFAKELAEILIQNVKAYEEKMMYLEFNKK